MRQSFRYRWLERRAESEPCLRRWRPCRAGQAGRAEKADGRSARRRQMVGTDPLRLPSRLQKTKLVVPADRPGCVRLMDEVDEVGAAAKNDVLGVDWFRRARDDGRSRHALRKGAALQQCDGGAVAGQRDRGSEASHSRANYNDVGGWHPRPAQVGGAHHWPTRFPVAKFWVAKFQAAMAAPQARTASFSAEESATRLPKTSMLRFAMRPSRR